MINLMFQWASTTPQIQNKSFKDGWVLYLESQTAEDLQHVHHHLKVLCFLVLSLQHTHAQTAKLVVCSLIQFLLSAIRSGLVSMPCPPMQSESIWMKAATHTVVTHGPSDWIYLVFAELSNVAAPQNTFNLNLAPFYCFMWFVWLKQDKQFVLLTEKHQVCSASWALPRRQAH